MAGKPAELTVEFDLDALTARDLEMMVEAERTAKFSSIAEILSRVVTKTSLGKASDPNIYLSAPYRVMREISRRLGTAVAEDAANFAQPPTST